MSDVPTRLLRDALRDAASPVPAAGCLDADMLAAWSDGALSRRERAVAESHASNCARCQALLAAMAKTELPAPPHKWWYRPAFGWLVPIAVGATAIVVWINVPASQSDRFAAVPPSPASSATSPTPADRVASTDTQGRLGQLPLPPALMPRQPAAATDQRRAEPLRSRQFELRALAPLQPRVPGDASKDLRETGVASSSAAPAGAPPPPQPAARDAAAPVAATEAAPQANTVAPVQAAAPFRPPPPATFAAALPDAPVQALAKAAAVSAPILSPDPNVRWRIAAAGSVDRSVDGGATWQAQSTGVPQTLTAGTAPAPAICWLVGPGGMVVLSIDGRTWQRVAIPELIDLISVRASDASNASVTAADGRTFTTTDGGKTWRP